MKATGKDFFTTPIFDYKGVRENWGDSLLSLKNLAEKDWFIAGAFGS